MKQNMKVILAVALVALCFCAAADAENITGTCGDALHWSFTSNTGVLTISGTGPMWDFNDEQPGWYSYRNPLPAGVIGVGVIGSVVVGPGSSAGIKSVVIESGVTSIGDRAFASCTSLTDVAVSADVERIGVGAFAGDDSLQRVTLLGKDTVIGDSSQDVFTGCGESLILCGWSGSTAEAYAQAAHLTFERYIPSGQCGSGVNWSLNTETGVLTISGTGAMEDYTYTDHAPWYSLREGITSAVIEGGVTGIGDQAFMECAGLTSVSIADGVTAIGAGAFALSGLTQVTLPDGVAVIPDSAFAYCTSLTDVVLPPSVTVIDSYAFGGCAGLTGIVLPGSVASIGAGAFEYCTGLSDIILPDSLTSLGLAAFHACAGLESVTFPGSLTLVPDSAFYECASLSRVIIPESVTAIGDEAFRYCPCLTDVTLRNAETVIGEDVFADGADVTLRGYPGSTAEAYALGHSYITFVPFPAVLTSPDFALPEDLTRIEYEAFCGGNMTSVWIPDSVTFLGDRAFAECASLSQIRIPASVSEIPADLFESIDTAQLTIFGTPGSAAETYAAGAGIRFEAE